MKRTSDIAQFVQTSRRVFRDCVLPNGAIIAARPDLPAYPSTVQDYGFVWVRDAAFVCVAAHLAGIHDIQEPFFRWVWERAEGVQRSGMIVSMYYPNGLRAGILTEGRRVVHPDRNLFAQIVHLRSEVQFDMHGLLLWAIADHQRRTGQRSSTTRKLAQAVADATVAAWNGRHFRVANWDIWEKFVARPERRENFSWSLAMCIRGLEEAESILGQDAKRELTISSMRTALERAYDPKRRTFLRLFGPRTRDFQPDASLFGLVYPSEQVAADDPRMLFTIERILKRCAGGLGGVKRHPGDTYSGEVAGGLHQKRGAGDWPWLSAWAAIVLQRQGRIPEAREQFDWVLQHGKGRPLPEQFHKRGTPSVPGLSVSHAFALFAAQELGLL